MRSMLDGSEADRLRAAAGNRAQPAASIPCPVGCSDSIVTGKVPPMTPAAAPVQLDWRRPRSGSAGPMRSEPETVQTMPVCAVSTMAQIIDSESSPTCVT